MIIRQEDVQSKQMKFSYPMEQRVILEIFRNYSDRM